MRIPKDVAGVLEVFQKLGDAARRGLHLAERHTRREVEEAVKRADLLRQRLKGPER